MTHQPTNDANIQPSPDPRTPSGGSDGASPGGRGATIPPVDEVPFEVYLSDSAAPSLAVIAKPAALPYVSLSEAFDNPESLVLPDPEWVEVVGDAPLIYPGRSHLLFGSSTTGKSLFAAHIALRAAADYGVRVGYLDYEDTFSLFATRLMKQGLTREQSELITYWKPVQMTGRPGRMFRGQLVEAGVQLLIVDSLAVALSRSGVDENHNFEIRRWFDEAVMALDELGVASLFIDHVGHSSKDDTDERLYQSRGGSAKRDALTGASYRLSAQTPISLEAGTYLLDLYCGKDRLGHRPPGRKIADVRFTVGEDETESFSVSKFDPSGVSRRKLESNMEALSRALEAHGSPATVDEMAEVCGVRKATLGTARDALAAAGFITVSPGEGRRSRAKVMTFVKPFRVGTSSSVPVPPTAQEEAPF